MMLASLANRTLKETHNLREMEWASNSYVVEDNMTEICGVPRDRDI